MVDSGYELEVSAGRPVPLAELRGPATRRLLALDQRGDLCSEHVKVLASCVEVHERTVWRWLEIARTEGRCERKTNTRFVITEGLRARLALLGGNAARLHRELQDEAAAGGAPVPSLATVHRAIRRDLSAGMRAGIRKGEKARRLFDVYLRREGEKHDGHRNQVWEGDHVLAPVYVAVDGRLLKPWVTWFIDCHTDGICGLAVTAGVPDRGSILAALRASILRDAPYGPFGGLPSAVRVDRGKDFLCQTVRAALGRYAVPVGDLPGYCPWLKGTVEALNGAVEEMFFRSLPRFVHGPATLGGRPLDPDEPALTLEGFVKELLHWVDDWNDTIPKPCLGGRTPRQAWLDDPTPVEDVPAQELRLMMLEDDGKVRLITAKGVQWGSRYYVGDWMTDNGGRRVRLRYMPHHDHEVEVFDAASGEHLGAAGLANRASAEKVREVRAARRRASADLAKTVRAAAKLRRERYAPSTVAEPAQRLGSLTEAEADAELAEVGHTRRRTAARSGLIPLPAPAPDWVLPRSTRPEPGQDAGEDPEPDIAPAGEAMRQDGEPQ